MFHNKVHTHFFHLFLVVKIVTFVLLLQRRHHFFWVSNVLYEN